MTSQVSKDLNNIVEAAAYYPDSVDVSTPRKMRHVWDGTRNDLCKSIESVENLPPQVKSILLALCDPSTFDELDLENVDGIVVEDGMTPLIHFERSSIDSSSRSYETLTIDLKDVEVLSTLVERTKQRTRRSWLTMMVGAVVMGIGIGVWWKRGSNVQK